MVEKRKSPIIPDRIVQKKVLALEGKDDSDFFTALLKHLEIADVQVVNVDGKDNFKNVLPAMANIHGFSEVEMFAVIRDADNDATAAFESVKNILRKIAINGETIVTPESPNQFTEENPKVGIFIMPGNFEAGMLEDLCLKTVQNHPAMSCVDAFMQCVSQLDNPPKNFAKARAQAFLATMPEIEKNVGRAAKK